MNIIIANFETEEQRAEIKQRFINLGHIDIDVLTPSECKLIRCEEYNKTAYKIISPYKFTDKEFVCKGLHKYRKTETGWMCNCGKQL